MILSWFNAREATEVGAALADQLAPRAVSAPAKKSKALQEMLRQSEHKVRPLRLNFFKRAKLANSFKWRLLEHGIEAETADELTEMLVLHLSTMQSGLTPGHGSAAASREEGDSRRADYLIGLGNDYFAQDAYAEAVASYQDAVGLAPNHVLALNNLGAALCKLGRYLDAENHFREAIRIKPNLPEAHNNLGNVLRGRGHVAEAEISLRRALKLKPNYTDARCNLGLTLILLGRLRDARARFEKVLKAAPRHADALLGMAQIAGMEGRFDEAETLLKRALAVNPSMPSAWATLAGLRKMTVSDVSWLEGAEAIAAKGIAPLEEADIRFAIGKYYDDVEDFKRAFQSYKRANELLKPVAENYAREARTSFVDDLIAAYTKEAIAHVAGGASDSMKPIFVVGMMRSGTSLTEQIISSHPSVNGAGELSFWGNAVREHETAVRQGLLGEPIRKRLAEDYLRVLSGHSDDARHVVDKAPVNSDHLGVIHSIFPNARIIHMRRDPIDTCLSCYFQKFSTSLNFTMDLSDLAHYYREHRRLMEHWHSVLPPGSILDVPYEELVADQAGWTRRMLQFIGLEWDERCLEFTKTKRSVVTASYWQVRQTVYTDSVRRSRHYEKFIAPLLSLKELDS
jgi:tetratricopeptide (TPR) repeat protein